MFDGGLLYRGNITNISGVTYVYDEVGKLVSVSENGTTTNITYDVSGNPLTYHNGMSFQWEMGRQLAGITNGSTTISYTYNEDGIRTSKTVNCVTTEYTLVDGRITYQTNGTTSMYFRYDGDDELIGIEYAVNGVTNEYYYVKNLQGDIIDILDNNGNVVVSYEYDAWGEILSVSGSLAGTVGQANPFKYRSYYYDNESGFYYLQSRYYDAGVRRFINADETMFLGASGTVLGYNLYAYCENNPVNYVDNTGYVVIANVIGAVIGGIIGIVGGAFLGKWLADKLNIKSTIKRKFFIGAVSLLVGASAVAIGYFIGPYIAKMGKTAIEALKKSMIKSACFVEGTLILTDNGHISIENICPGDLVWAENLVTGEKGLKTVVEVFVNEADTLVSIFTENDKIITTEEHPFWVDGKGWCEAKNLIVGDILKMQNDATTKIVAISIEYLNEPINVYNFEVQDWHTYYVADSNILVHNACSLKFVRKSATQIEKMLSAKPGTFHRVIKPAILKSVGKNVLNKVGSNPDILIAQDGTIQLVSTIKKGVSVITTLNIYDFIP